MIVDLTPLVAGNGTSDDTQALNNALAQLLPGQAASLGKAVCRIDGNLTIPKGVALIADNPQAGTLNTGVNSTTNDTLNRKGHLKLKSTATILMRQGSTIQGLLITRQGLPALPLNQAAVDAFAGTAIQSLGDDVAVLNCLVLGFNLAFRCAGNQRPLLDGLRGDCTNGVEITNCLDVARIRNCHFWPYTTVNGWAGSPLTRRGIAFDLHDTVDGAKLTDNFAFGYNRGFRIASANAASLIGCGADNFYQNGAPANPGSIGIEVIGTSNQTKITACKLAANAQAGVHVMLSDPNATVQIATCMLWGGSTHGVLSNGGTITVHGSHFQDVPHGITRNGQGAILSDGNVFTRAAGAAFQAGVPSNNQNLIFGRNIYHQVANEVIGAYN